MKFSLFTITALLSTIASVHSHGDDAHDQGAGGDISWYNTKKSLPVARSDLTGTVSSKSGTDMIYLIGGCTGGNVYFADYDFYGCAEITNANTAYDTVNDVYIDKEPVPTARFRHATVNVLGDLFVIGGVNLYDELVTTIERYNPLTDTWTVFGTWEGATTDLTAWKSGTDIYVAGGYTPPDYDASDKVFKIDTTVDFAVVEVAKLPTGGRGDLNSAVIGDYAYVTSGFTHDDKFCNSLNTTERFSLVDFTWEVVAPLINSNGDNALMSMNGLLYSIGGENKVNCSSTTPVEVVEVYDPAVNVWKEETKIQEETFRFVAVADEATDSIFIFGGQNYYNATCNCYPVTDKVLHFHDQDWVVDDFDMDSAANAVGINVFVGVSAIAVAIVAAMI